MTLIDNRLFLSYFVFTHLNIYEFDAASSSY